MHHIMPVTESTPELFADKNYKWRSIGNRYWQTDAKDGITLEIHETKPGVYRWFLYADDSPEPDLAVTLDDADSIAAALAALYEQVDSYRGLGI